MKLLRQTIFTKSQREQDSDTHPSKFQHGEIGVLAQRLHFALHDQPREELSNGAKRRRLSPQGEDPIDLLTAAICESLDIAPLGDGDVIDFEQLFL